MENSDDNLPQHLCGDCMGKLEVSYAFVLQARQVQEQLLHKIRNELQCLDEAPIDIIPQSIKTETEINLEQTKDGVDDKVVTGSVAALKLQPESETDSNHADVAG